jgi:hypothetical protein
MHVIVLFIVLLAAITLPFTLYAETSNSNRPELNQSFSYNFGNTLLLFAGGLALKKPTGGGVFLPFHFAYQRKKSDEDITEMDMIYRYDNHDTFQGYNEYLVLLGKRFRVDKWDDWTWGAKAGFGYASGLISNKYEDEDGKIFSLGKQKTYRCFEGAAKLDLKKETEISDGWNYQYGAGVLFIIPLVCQNTQSWSTIGTLVHRVVPVLDLSVNYNF